MRLSVIFEPLIVVLLLLLVHVVVVILRSDQAQIVDVVSAAIARGLEVKVVPIIFVILLEILISVRVQKFPFSHQRCFSLHSLLLLHLLSLIMARSVFIAHAPLVHLLTLESTTACHLNAGLLLFAVGLRLALTSFSAHSFDVGALARFAGYVPPGLLKFSVLAELFLPLDPVATVANAAYEGQKAGQ